MGPANEGEAMTRSCYSESVPSRIPGSAHSVAATSFARRAGVALVAMFLFVPVGRGDEQNDWQRAELLAQMRALAEQTKVHFAEGERQPELAKDAALRYADQPRGFVDATLWVWTHQGRPVAFEKIEALNSADSRPHWQYCFASVSSELLLAEWPNRRFRSTEPGVAFTPLKAAPAVSTGNTERKRQTRELARKFSARIETEPKEEMRLLTTPLFDYADPKTKQYRGAVFGFSTNGTNPDLLLLLEVRGEKDKAAWHFAPARMTTGALTLRWGDTKVWECESVRQMKGPLTTWTYFVTTRKPPGDEEKKR
jgi:hypothetical protein